MKIDNKFENNSCKKWYIINAKNIILGRLASKISYIIQGKHKSEFSYNKDIGDYVIVINTKYIIVTGKKLYQKNYYKHTGYIGGIKKINLKSLLVKNFKYALIHAVKGMLPKNKIGKLMINKLKIYEYSFHNHIAQKPIVLNI